MITAVILVLLSVLLIVYTTTNALLESDDKESLLHIVGYVLTPLAVVLCLAWDMVSQRKGMHDINFFPRDRYTKILRVLTVTSFIVAWFHVEPLAKAFAEKLAS